MEENDRFTVAFDRTLNPGGALGTRVNPATGQRVRRRARLRWRQWRQHVSGQPAGGEDLAARRAGLLVQSQDRPSRRLRDLLGAVELSGRRRHQLRPDRLQPVRPSRCRTSSSPTCPFTNPFPGGVLQPVGNSLGALAGVGGEIEFIDQDKKAPYVHQYSVDVNRELPGNIADRLRVRRRDRPRSRSRRLERRHHQHQPGDPRASGARCGAERPGAEPVLRPAGRARASTSRARPSRARSRCGRSRSSPTS